MHDTFLLNKISNSLEAICNEKNIRGIDEFTIVVNNDSHINKENLLEHLKLNNKDIISENLKIRIEREDIEELTAIIKVIKGETFEGEK